MANGLRNTLATLEDEEQRRINEALPLQAPVTPLTPASQNILAAQPTPLQRALGTQPQTKPLLRPAAQTAPTISPKELLSGSAVGPMERPALQTKFGTVEGTGEQLRRVAEFERTGLTTAQQQEQAIIKRGNEQMMLREAAKTERNKAAREQKAVDQQKDGIRAGLTRTEQWASNNASKSPAAQATADFIQTITEPVGTSGVSIYESMTAPERKSFDKLIGGMRSAGDRFAKGSIAGKRLAKAQTISDRALARHTKKLATEAAVEEETLAKADALAKVEASSEKRKRDDVKFREAVTDKRLNRKLKQNEAQADLNDKQLVAELDKPKRKRDEDKIDLLRANSVKLAETRTEMFDKANVEQEPDQEAGDDVNAVMASNPEWDRAKAERYLKTIGR